MGAKHQSPEYKRARAHLQRNRTEHTRCWRCGLTLAERRITHPGAVFHAGHVDPDGSPYLLDNECSTPCNLPDGARRGNANRHTDSLDLMDSKTTNTLGL